MIVKLFSNLRAIPIWYQCYLDSFWAYIECRELNFMAWHRNFQDLDHIFDSLVKLIDSQLWRIYPVVVKWVEISPLFSPHCLVENSPYAKQVDPDFYGNDYAQHLAKLHLDILYWRRKYAFHDFSLPCQWSSRYRDNDYFDSEFFDVDIYLDKLL